MLSQVPARQPLELLGTLPNWSPSVDFVTTDEFSTWNQAVSETGNAIVPWQNRQLRRPDRVFATSGRGMKGSITEYRYGLKANIGLDLDYGSGVKQAWLIPSSHPASPKGFHLLLSMPDRSIAVYLSEDFSLASVLNPDTISYDLSSPTLAVACSDQLTVQLTKGFVALVGPGNRYEGALKSVPGKAPS
jgi:hypothetical protein